MALESAHKGKAPVKAAVTPAGRSYTNATGQTNPSNGNSFSSIFTSFIFISLHDLHLQFIFTCLLRLFVCLFRRVSFVSVTFFCSCLLVSGPISRLLTFVEFQQLQEERRSLVKNGARRAGQLPCFVATL